MLLLFQIVKNIKSYYGAPSDNPMIKGLSSVVSGHVFDIDSPQKILVTKKKIITHFSSENPKIFTILKEVVDLLSDGFRSTFISEKSQYLFYYF